MAMTINIVIRIFIKSLWIKKLSLLIKSLENNLVIELYCPLTESNVIGTV